MDVLPPPSSATCHLGEYVAKAVNYAQLRE